MAPFTLEVELRGLCLLVMHNADKDKITVLMPDGRDKGAAHKFPDDKFGKPHVGYLCCDMANVAGSAPTLGQLVHRFDSEELDFGLKASAAGTHQFDVPNANCFAHELHLPSRALATPLVPGVLLRTDLLGGTLEAAKSGPLWEINSPFGKLGTMCGGPFAEGLKWTVSVPTDSLTLTLKKAAATRDVTLKPVVEGGVVKVVLGNLCCENPLRWTELGENPGIEIREDDDFRWFYELLEPRVGTYKQLLTSTSSDLPVPQLERRGARRGNPPGCNSLRITV